MSGQPFFTPAWIVELARPFTLAEHGFKGKDDKGNPYILKNAITARLNRVVPGEWSMGRPEIVANINDVITVTSPLTIKGQTHWGLGSGTIQRFRNKTVKNDEGQDVSVPYEISPFDLAAETSKATKGAATDVLTRAALAFEIGWYMRDIPAQYKTMITTRPGLAKYLEYVNRLYDEHYGNAQSASSALRPPVTASGKPIDPNTGELPPRAETPATPPTSPQAAIKEPPPGAKPPVTNNAPQQPTSQATWRSKLWEEAKPLFGDDQALFDKTITAAMLSLAGKTQEEAMGVIRFLRWNRDEIGVGIVIQNAKALAMEKNEMFEALSEASGHPVTKWTEWTGGDLTRGLGALLAWAGGYNVSYLPKIATEHDLGHQVVEAARVICDAYQKAKESA